MGIEQTYITLRKYFAANKDGECFSVTIRDLSVVFGCTRRNAQLIIKKMIQSHLIIWKPGKGRGNTSEISFLQPINQLILKRAKELVYQEMLDEAWKLIDQLPTVKFEFTEWLYHYLGFQHTDEEDILRFPFYRPVLNLDPTFVHRRTEAHLISQLFDTLVKFDEKTKELVPNLAHFWESNAEKTVWRFYLRKGIRFHHGKGFTSEDVHFTFQRILKESSVEDIKGSIKEVKMIEKYMIEFTLHEPNVLFVHYLSTERCSILPQDLDVIEVSQDFATLPIGTGPFRMKKNNETVLQLEANDYYFKGRPLLDGIEMWIWPNYDETKIIRKLEMANFYIGDYPGNQSPQTQLTNLEQGATFLTFNLQKQGVMQNVFFRKAVHFALNRHKMIRDLAEMRELPACSFFPEHSQEHFQQETDIERAKSFLRKSGYQGEELTLYTYEMPSNEQNAGWIQKDLRQIGVNVVIVILPVTELINRPVLRELADMVVAGEVLGKEPDIELIKMFSYQNGFIYNHLNNNQLEIVEKWLSACKREESRDKRIQYLIYLQQELQKQFPYIFLYHAKQSIKHSHTLQGAVLNGWGNIDYKDLWIKRE